MKPDSQNISGQNQTKSTLKKIWYNRVDFRTIVIQFFTGHNYLNRHSFLLKETEPLMCRLCKEVEETSEPVLCLCPMLCLTRLKCTGAHTTDTRECPFNAATCPTLSHLIDSYMDGKKGYIN
jgi:hypothetical protein